MLQQISSGKGLESQCYVDLFVKHFLKQIFFKVYGHMTISLSNKNACLYSSCITGNKEQLFINTF